MIHAEFGGPTPVSLSNYYRGGGLVPNTPANQNIPTSGPIALSHFYGAAAIVNDPPVWSTNSNLGYHTANSSIGIQLRADDPESGPVTYSVTSYLPSWLTLSPTGYLQGTAPPESDPAGRAYGFEVDATDNMGATTTKLFNIRIRPAQATWFSPSMTLDGSDGGPQNFYFYVNDPNGDAQIMQTPGFSLPPNSTLLQEWPESTQPNLKGVTLRGNIIPVGDYTIYLDLVDQYATTTRAFYIKITPAGSGSGGGGGGGGGGDQGGVVAN